MDEDTMDEDIMVADFTVGVTLAGMVTATGTGTVAIDPPYAVSLR